MVRPGVGRPILPRPLVRGDFFAGWLKPEGVPRRLLLRFGFCANLKREFKPNRR
jgi:hypothetical protein